MDKVHGKQGDNKQMLLLPMSPKMDYSAPNAMPETGNTGAASGNDQSMPAIAPDRRQSEKSSLSEKTTLSEEALNLLDQYSTKAKTDCNRLIQLFCNQPVSEDTLIDGKVPVADTNAMDIPAIYEQAKVVADDVSAMQKITDSSVPPDSDLPNKRDYWLKYWGQTKNHTGEASLDTNDLLANLKTFYTPSPDVNKLADDAVSAYQALNDVQGGIAHLLTSSKKDWNNLWELQANKDVISPLSKVSEATDNLFAAKLRLQIASRIDPEIWKSGLGMIARGAASPYGVGAAVGIGVTLFRGIKAHMDNNKVGDEALNEIKACVTTFHEAQKQCDEYIRKGESKADAVSLQQVKHFDEELQQVLPQLDDLNQMADKHKGWKQLNKAITGLVIDERIQDLSMQSRSVLNQFETSSDR